MKRRKAEKKGENEEQKTGGSYVLHNSEIPQYWPKAMVRKGRTPIRHRIHFIYKKKKPSTFLQNIQESFLRVQGVCEWIFCNTGERRRSAWVMRPGNREQKNAPRMLKDFGREFWNIRAMQLRDYRTTPIPKGGVVPLATAHIPNKSNKIYSF